MRCKDGRCISLEDGQITIKPVLNSRTDEIVSYDIIFPLVDENNTNLTVKELDFIEDVRDQLKKFEKDNKRMVGTNGRNKEHKKGESC